MTSRSKQIGKAAQAMAETRAPRALTGSKKVSSIGRVSVDVGHSAVRLPRGPSEMWQMSDVHEARSPFERCGVKRLRPRQRSDLDSVPTQEVRADERGRGS